LDPPAFMESTPVRGGKKVKSVSKGNYLYYYRLGKRGREVGGLGAGKTGCNAKRQRTNKEETVHQKKSRPVTEYFLMLVGCWGGADIGNHRTGLGTCPSTGRGGALEEDLTPVTSVT